MTQADLGKTGQQSRCPKPTAIPCFHVNKSFIV